MRGEVDALVAVLVVQLTQAGQGGGCDREAEAGHDGDVLQSLAVGIGGERMPLLDLGAREIDGLGFARHQQSPRLWAGRLDAATGDDAQAPIARFLKEEVLGMGERRPEDKAVRRTRGDHAVDPLHGGLLGVFGVSVLRLRGEDAVVEPLEQLATAVGVAAPHLREVHVRVDEAGEQEGAVVVDLCRARVFRRQLGPVAAPGDDALVIDHECPVGEVREVICCLRHEGRPGDVEDVAAMDGGHGGAPRGFKTGNC